MTTPGTPPLLGYRVADLSSGVAGGYCTKLLADAGATVVKVEAPEGDPLRRWTATGAPLAPGEDGALFRFLSAGKRSLVADPDEPDALGRVAETVAAADAVVWSPGSRLALHPSLRPTELRRTRPGLVVAAITPWGLDGPWADRPASDLTLQALGGGVAIRGVPSHAPLSCGGRPSEWLAGMFTAVGLLVARHRSRISGTGELLDVSMLESLVLTQDMYPVTYWSIAGYPWRGERTPNIPGSEPTLDGYVGFTVVTAQTWHDFCVLAERPDWADDESLYFYKHRRARWSELIPAIRRWTATKTTAELVETASLLRIPVAPVGNGTNVAQFDHLVARAVYEANPTGGFRQPRVPYRLGGGAGPRAFGPSPALGELGGQPAWEPRAADHGPALPAAPDPSLPFAGLRVLEFTSMWAGPLAGHLLAMLGADVIHVESTKRPDAIRANTIRTVGDDLWWEWSPPFQGPNTNKRDLTIDMDAERGRTLALRLAAQCDVVIENYSPRVLDHWGLGYEELSATRPDLIMVRMPAFGLDGPWRDRVGYAQTMEQVSGLAWVTGHPDEPPQTPNGPCDAVAGTHATFALLLALEHRRRTGRGMLVEVPMVEAALNLAAEQVVEFSAYGRLLERTGNRGPTAAPQNLYLTADLDEQGRRDRWIAIAVCTDEQWQALCGVVGDPVWAADATLATAHGRRAAQDALDQALGAWCATRRADDVTALLTAAGVPAAPVLLPHETRLLPQLLARGFYETVEHPITGPMLHEGYPVRFSGGPDRLHRRHAPLLGEHNTEILRGLLGLDDAEIDALDRDGVIGRRPVGEHRAR